MLSMKRESLDRALAPSLVYTTAATCGVLAALALQIQLSRAGYDLLALWQNLLSARTMQLRSAGPWWAIAGMAFVIGGVMAAVLSRMPLPWRGFRLLRWLAGAAVVFILSDIGQHSAGLTQTNVGASVLASLGVLALAALMSLGGAYLTIRR
jgi:hypothetical protein